MAQQRRQCCSIRMQPSTTLCWLSHEVRTVAAEPFCVAMTPQVRGAAPAVRARVVGELLQHLLATFSSVVAEQLVGLSRGGALQVPRQQLRTVMRCSTLVMPTPSAGRAPALRECSRMSTWVGGKSSSRLSLGWSVCSQRQRLHQQVVEPPSLHRVMLKPLPCLALFSCCWSWRSSRSRWRRSCSRPSAACLQPRRTCWPPSSRAASPPAAPPAPRRWLRGWTRRSVHDARCISIGWVVTSEATSVQSVQRADLFCAKPQTHQHGCHSIHPLKAIR